MESIVTAALFFLKTQDGDRFHEEIVAHDRVEPLALKGVIELRYLGAYMTDALAKAAAADLRHQLLRGLDIEIDPFAEPLVCELYIYPEMPAACDEREFWQTTGRTVKLRPGRSLFLRPGDDHVFVHALTQPIVTTIATIAPAANKAANRGSASDDQYRVQLRPPRYDGRVGYEETHDQNGNVIT